MTRKYYLLFGALCFFAYSWARPYIRKGFGSASQGYLNFYALYITWLCSAVFYHLPSLAALGLDAKADTSLLIVVFLATLAVRGRSGGRSSSRSLSTPPYLKSPRVYLPGRAACWEE